MSASAEIRLDVPGLEQAINGMRMDITRLTRQARFVWKNEVLLEAGRIYVEEIRSGTPVATGELRESIIFRAEPDQIVVKATAPHAIYLEEGTKPSPGRYVPALDRRLVRGRTHRPTRVGKIKRKAGVIKAKTEAEMWWRKPKGQGGAGR